MSFFKEHKYLIFGILIFACLFFMWQSYADTIREQQMIERERIASQERLQEAERLRLEEKNRQEEALAQQRLEQEKVKFEQEKELAKQVAQQKAEAADTARTETLRKECKALQDKNIISYESFLNSCTRSNSLEYCDSSPAGKLFADDFTNDWIQRCITSKKKTGW